MNRQIKGMIIAEFLARPTHRMSRIQLMKQFWTYDMSNIELSALLGLFVDSGILELESPDNYVMPDTQVEEIRKKFQKK